MAAKTLNINVTGGAATFGQVIQGDSVNVQGPVNVAAVAPAFEAFRRAVRAEMDANAVGAGERKALEERTAALEAAVKSAGAKGADAGGGGEPPLEKVARLVGQIKAAFGWTAPLLKELCAACCPGLGVLF
jgi:hypothetical protein